MAFGGRKMALGGPRPPVAGMADEAGVCDRCSRSNIPQNICPLLSLRPRAPHVLFSPRPQTQLTNVAAIWLAF